MALIEVDNITRTFETDETKTVVLRGISFSIEQGEFVSIMGRSGSGKSTLLHILGLLDRPTSGIYRFEGEDTSARSDEELAHIRNSQMGFVFQAFHLLSRATVLDNIMLPLFYSTIPQKEHTQYATVALEKVGLSHRLAHTPSQLSGGEKQRVAIARALVTNPSVVFADEPTGNLDSKTSEMVMNTVDLLHKEGKTVILITHETATASFANRIITIHDGLVESDTLAPERHQHYEK